MAKQSECKKEMEFILDFQSDLFKRLNKNKDNFDKLPKDRITKVYLEGKLEVVEQLWSEFLSGHKELFLNVHSEDLANSTYAKEDIYDQMEELYSWFKCDLKTSLLKFTSSNDEQGTSQVVHGKNSQVKLPKINIPTFSGKYLEWPTFKDLFKSLVHSNDDLEDIQKFHYLKGYLTGEAEQLVRHISIADCNYDRCWQLLEERYNNKKYLCQQTLKRLFSQKNIVNESASALKELIDTTNDCLSTLQNIGINVDSWDVVVIHILTLKLDIESRRQWEFKISETNLSDELPTYKQFKEFLTNRYRAIEFLDSRSTVGNIKNVTNSNTKSMHITRNFKCPFCSEGGHKLSYCKTFCKEPVEFRRQFVLKNNVCFNCLETNHSAKLCKNITKCQICKRKHHSLLHPRGNVTKCVGDDRKESVVASPTKNSETNTSVSCSSTGKTNQVLLPTAIVKAVSTKDTVCEIRALLDQGSETSFVTEDTVQRLGLKKTPTNEQLSGVGGDRHFISKSVVNMKISSRIDPKEIVDVKAYVLKSITSFLPSNKMEPIQWIEKANLPLADPIYYTPNRIDLLLGADVYGQILRDGVKRGASGTPVAQLTSLGWTLSGKFRSTNETETRSREKMVRRQSD